VGHYGGLGVTAAAMVCHVSTTPTSMCVVFCARCTQEYFHVAKPAPVQVFLGSSKGMIQRIFFLFQGKIVMTKKWRKHLFNHVYFNFDSDWK